jgi:hypothetical protein
MATASQVAPVHAHVLELLQTSGWSVHFAIYFWRRSTTAQSEKWQGKRKQSALSCGTDEAVYQRLSEYVKINRPSIPTLGMRRLIGFHASGSLAPRL